MSTSELSITGIEHLEDYQLRIHFSDGKLNIIDFGPWINALPTEEEREYLKPAKFKEYQVHLGHALVWGEFDIIFPITALYHENPDLLQTGIPVNPPPGNTPVRKRVVGASKRTSRLGAKRSTTER